ncbi:MAG: aminotransferase class III-fold pyridoxal phosphate-dependent enzyme, partial [Chloroflexi bacterium]
ERNAPAALMQRAMSNTMENRPLNILRVITWLPVGGIERRLVALLPRLREVCHRYGILLIVDEVQSGMGRTGKMWAIQHAGVEPDIVCSAKGIASGMPLGAMIARQSIMTWPRGAHGSTYAGNPLACAAALATIALLENGLMDNAAQQGAFLLEALGAMRSRHPSIGHLRGKGLMIGIELVRDQVTKEPATDLCNAVVYRAFEHGLLLLSCGRSVVRIVPALHIALAAMGSLMVGRIIQNVIESPRPLMVPDIAAMYPGAFQGYQFDWNSFPSDHIAR